MKGLFHRAGADSFWVLRGRRRPAPAPVPFTVLGALLGVLFTVPRTTLTAVGVASACGLIVGLARPLCTHRVAAMFVLGVPLGGAFYLLEVDAWAGTGASWFFGGLFAFAYAAIGWGREDDPVTGHWDETRRGARR